jgi:serine O-acetyltransferase
MREGHACEGSTLAGMRRCIRADIDRAISYASAYSGAHVSTLRRISFALTPPLMCVMLHRLAHLAHARSHRRLGRLFARVNQIVHRADISPASCMGPGLYVPHTSGIIVNAISGPNLTLYYRACVLPALPVISRAAAVTGPGAAIPAVPRLGSNVTLGVFSVVYGPVVLSDNVSVGATVSVVENIGSGVNLSPLTFRRRRTRSAARHA